MIRLDRRQFVESSAAVVVLGGAMGSLALPPSARGEAPLMRRQAPGFHRSQIGQFEIIALSDGFSNYQRKASPRMRRRRSVRIILRRASFRRTNSASRRRRY